MSPEINRDLVAFLETLDDPSGLVRGYDYLTDVLYFVKDSQSRLVTGNKTFCVRTGISDRADLTGLTDFDLHPKNLAKIYIEDDQRVFSTGKPLVNRFEQLRNEIGKLDWVCTTKIPLFDQRGNIVGLQGISRRSNEVFSYECSKPIQLVIAHVQDHLAEPLTLAALSRVANLSVRQLSRHIQDQFGESTHAFVLRMRVQAASEALMTTNDSILEIAHRCGFSDQSAFTKTFRRQVGLTPRQFRERYRGR